MLPVNTETMRHQTFHGCPLFILSALGIGHTLSCLYKPCWDSSQERVCESTFVSHCFCWLPHQHLPVLSSLGDRQNKRYYQHLLQWGKPSPHKAESIPRAPWQEFPAALDPKGDMRWEFCGSWFGKCEFPWKSCCGSVWLSVGTPQGHLGIVSKFHSHACIPPLLWNSYHTNSIQQFRCREQRFNSECDSLAQVGAQPGGRCHSLTT